ncbi:hypothetical protein [Saccharicrinis sp. FJH54]|uniref:hypothetical protein n=1 Tax=Saccharicrinis sp. FJH54 TaxID=3344665 RepID=UPI0035D47405
MKTKMLIPVVLLFSGLLFGNLLHANVTVEDALKVSVLYSSELESLALNLSDSFNAANGDVSVTAKPYSEKSGELKENDLILLSDKDLSKGSFQDNWKMVVGRSVVVPLINRDNPFYKEIIQQGVTIDELSRVLQNPEHRNWKHLLGESFSADILVYVENNSIVEKCLAELVNTNQADLSVQVVPDGNEIQHKLKTNKTAIALCLLSDIETEQEPFKGDVQILPIDRNGNGIIDQTENIYQNKASFNRGVWIGKYPRNMYSNVYLASMKQPQQVSEIGFVKWVITEGQPLLPDYGLQELVYSEIPSKTAQLNEPLQTPVIVEPKPFLARYIVFIGLAVLLLIVGFELWIRSGRRQKRNTTDVPDQPKPLDVANMGIPQGMYFDKTHTWAFMEKNGNVRIGIDDFLAQISGPYTRVVLKSEGEKVTKGEHMLTIVQEGKQIKINAPVSGIVQALNEELIYDATKLNKVPYDEGWIYQITPDNWNIERIYLNSAFKYKKWISQEYTRFKDFITTALSRIDTGLNTVVLQDGGELNENTLSKMSPDIWEEFQSQFLDR